LLLAGPLFEMEPGGVGEVVLGEPTSSAR